MTAKEFLNTQVPDNFNQPNFSFGDTRRDVIEKAMVEFAKLHVEKALISAAKQKPVRQDIDSERLVKVLYQPLTLKDAILKSYPLKNIK